jgi:hypothetical protein
MNNPVENPGLVLLNLQKKASATMEIVNKNESEEKTHLALADFIDEPTVVLFQVDSLSIKVYFPHNEAPFTVTGLKITAGAWSNLKKSAIDCKILLRLELIFDTVLKDLVWKSSLYSIEVLKESLIISNGENTEKDLRIESLEKFNELHKAIINGFEKIGIAYHIKLS